MKAVKLFMMAATFAALVTGCTDKENPKPDPKPDEKPATNTLTANAGTNLTVQVGQTVTLDGSASKDSENKTFSYQWAFAKKPAASTVTLTGPSTVKPTFVPDEVGEYEVELTIANDKFNHKSKVLVTATAASPLAIDADIRVKTVLEDRIANPDLPDYVVKREIGVSDELTIMPGVTIAFERDTKLNINSQGIIIAKGTAQKKIRFVGKENVKGYWAGIMMYSGSSFNEFDYVEVLHGGSKTLLSGVKANIAFFAGNKAALSVRNSLFGQGAGYGMYVQDGSVLTAFEKNTFTNNSEAGIVLNADNVKMLDAASVFTGSNGRNVVEIDQSAIHGGANGEVVWAAFNDKTPYRVNTLITATTAWKLEPGVTIEMSRDAELRINGNGGYLKAVGTPEKKIVITGVEKTAGYWRGIMSYSTSAQNQIENAEISFGGSQNIISGQKANIALHGNQAILSVKNSKISGSGGYGIFGTWGSKVNTDADQVNTFEANAKEGVYVQK